MQIFSNYFAFLGLSYTIPQIFLAKSCTVPQILICKKCVKSQNSVTCDTFFQYLSLTEGSSIFFQFLKKMIFYAETPQ